MANDPVDWAYARSDDAIKSLREAAVAIVDGIVGHSLDDAPDKTQHQAMHEHVRRTISLAIGVQLSRPEQERGANLPIVSVIATRNVGAITLFLNAFKSKQVPAPEPELEGATISTEYNYLCIRNSTGWLLWKRKLQDCDREMSFTDIIAAAVTAQRGWLKDGAPEPKPEDA